MGGDWMDEKANEPYRELFITITVQSPFITFQPPQILFIPVPLENKVTATLTLHASGYPRLVCLCKVLQSHFYFTVTQFRKWRKLEPSAVFLSIYLVNVSRGTTVSAEVDEVEQEDGTKIQPVSVLFPSGNIIPPKPLDEVQPWEPIYKALAPTFLLCPTFFFFTR